MSQLFALEWDSREIRLMVASGRGRQVVIEQAVSIPCDVDISETNAPEEIGRRIATELDARGLGRGEVVVAVGRNNIELRQLQLPPAPDEDLPDMVRFQATREFNELDDKWLLDFIPIEGSESTPRTVLATAIAPAVLAQIEAVCEHAGLKMRRLLLRPCEAAQLLESEKSIPRGQSILLVSTLGSEADLTAVVDGVAVFLRTTRIVSDPPPLQAMLAEIRLTMAAASNQLGGRKIESIVLCGHQQVHLDLARSIEKELGIHVELFDPLGGVKLGRALVESPPQHPGRFAPLVGMLLTELMPSNHAVDFLHPRRRAERPDNRKKWVAAGVAVAVLLLAWIIYLRMDHARLLSTVNELAQESKKLDESLVRERAKEIHTTTTEIAKVVGDEVIWLDRLYDLNQSFPTAEDAIISQFTVNSTIRGGQIDLKGSLRKQEVIARLEEKIGAHGEVMELRGTGENRTDSPYPKSFDAFVHPKPSEKQ